MAKKAAKPKGVGEMAGVLRLKVTLLGTQPPVWRQIEVPAEYTFWDLHVALQNAMGWTDSHLHAFRIVEPESGEEVQVGIPEGEETDFQILPGWEFLVASALHKAGDAVEYEYDFGDGWQHEIALEGVHQAEPGAKYPRCIAGARACPPDDCGGVGGYEDLLKTLKKPGTKEYREIREWLGRPFDPEAFDATEVEFDDPKRRWKEVFQFRPRKT